MTLVSKNIPGFYNGVNQQAAPIRLDTQLDAQENGYSSLVDGLTKRQNTEHVATLSTTGTIHPEDYLTHTINRDETEQYEAIFTGEEDTPLRIFKTDGTECTVQYGNLAEDLAFTADASVKDYLLDCEPRKDIRCITVSDYTLVTNRTVTVEMDTDVAPHVLSGKVQTFSRLIGFHPEAYRELATGDGLNNSFEAPYYLNQSDIRVKVQNSITTAWSWKNSSFIKTDAAPSSGYPVEVYRIAEPDVLEVSGDESNKFDSYFVKLVDKVWKEVAKPGILTTFKQSTMPHRIVRTATNTFTVAPIDWVSRDSGDDITNPVPSFVGYKVNNILFFKGRLGFLSQERVVLSKTNDFFNFWGSTALDVLDDDPIDVDSSSTLPNSVVNLMEYAPFDANLILMSNNQQFSLGAVNATLTPTTVAITPITGFEFNPYSMVGVAGTNVLFTGRKGDYLTVREYFVQPDSLMNDAADVTGHIPNYIPNGMAQVVVCNPLDTAFVLSSGDYESIYVYKYFWTGNEKSQNSWSKWTFNGGKVYGMGIIETDLFLIIERDGELNLEKIRLKNMETGTLGFRVHLDRLKTLTGVSSGLTTVFTFPYDVSGTDIDEGLYDVIDTSTGLSVPISSHTTTTFTVKGYHASVYFGQNYTFRMRLNEQYIKGSDKAPIIEGKWLLRTLTLAFDRTGYFKVSITPEARDSVTHEYTGTVLGRALIGTPLLSTTQERFLVLSKNRGTTIDVTNPTYLPCSFQTGSIEGEYVTRSRRRV